MEKQEIELNMNKGIFTLEEVVDLLHSLGYKVKITENKNRKEIK